MLARPKVIPPEPDASLAEKRKFKEQEAREQTIDPRASIFHPGTEPFTLVFQGRATVLHAALDEVYLPPVATPQGEQEIITIPKVADLREWQTRASEISPEAQMVLYPPEEPRNDKNVLLLGRTLILTAENPASAQAQAGRDGLEFVEALAYAPGRYLVSSASPAVSLELLRRGKQNGAVLYEGDFGRIQFPRAVNRTSGILSRLRAPAKKPVVAAGKAAGTASAAVAASSAVARFTPNDTLYTSQWHLQNTGQGGGKIGIDANVIDAWQTFTGAGVRVGIVDDGLQILHPDLSPNVATNALIHHDWNDTTPNDPSPGVNNAHGTSCGGVAAAKGGNSLGVTGVAPDASLVGLRLIAAATSDRMEAEAFGWQGSLVEIKSNSWGPADDGRTIAGPGTLASAALQSAVSTGRGGKGTVFLWAAGNGYSYDNSNYDGYANSIYTIAISAISNQGSASYYSERGGNIALSAPSNGGSLGITTTDLTGVSGYSGTDYTSSFGGTSSACPLVAGVAALILQANPSLSWRDVKEILMRSATPLDTGNTTWVNNGAGIAFSSQYGAGMVNASSAVEMAQDWENLLPLRSTTANGGAFILGVPDNNSAGVLRPITINDDFRVESVAVTLSALHLWRGDLVASLISPSGTEVSLTTLRYDSADHWSNVVFTSPHFLGERSKGTWQVRVADVDPIITGTFTGASLTVYGSDSPSPPANDNFENATEFSGTSAAITASNRGATRQTYEPRHADQRGGGSLWWNYRGDTSGYLSLNTSGSAIDTLLAVYRGSSLSGLQLVKSSDDVATGNTASQILRLPVEVGDSLKIAVDGKARARGNFRLNANLEVGALHDLFADAKPQTANSWSDSRTTASSSGLTQYSAESGEPAHAGYPAQRSVWYAWQPSANSTATVHTQGSSFDTVLAVYQGSSLSRLRWIASNDNETPSKTSSLVTFGVRSGETYYLALDGKNGATGGYTLTASLGPSNTNGVVPPVTAPPSNDNLSNAISITGAPLRINGSNRSATGQTGEPGSVIPTSVWYRWTAPRSGVVTVTTDGSLFDTTLGAYQGSTVTGLTALPAYPAANGVTAVNDNATSSVRWSRVRFSATAGTDYLLRIDGARSATGRYRLNINY